MFGIAPLKVGEAGKKVDDYWYDSMNKSSPIIPSNSSPQATGEETAW